MLVFYSVMNIQPISFTSQYKSTYKAPKNRKIEYSEAEFDDTLKKINSNVSNPCAYQIYDIKDKIPKTRENTMALEGFCEGKMDYDQFLAQISYNNICNAINSKYDATTNVIEKAKQIEESFLKGDEDASTYEMILDSIENKVLLPNVLFGLEKKGWFKDDFLEDVNKYYDAKASNQNIEEVFVPKFASKGEALDKTPRGGGLLFGG